MKDSGTHWIAGMAIAATAVIAATSAHAQYAPYGPAAQVAAGQQGYAPAPQTGYPHAQPPTGYPQTPPAYGYGAYAPPPNQTTPPAYGYAPQQPAYPAQAAARPGYPAMAQAPTEQLPIPAESTNGSPVIENGGTYNGGYPSANGYPATSGDHVQPTPAPGYESYPATNGYHHNDGTYTGGYNGYSGGECSTCGYGYQGAHAGYGYGYGADACGGYGCYDYGVSGHFGGQSCRQCFIGVYGLFMTRDDSAKCNTAIMIDHTGLTPPGDYPYYPPNGHMPPVVWVANTDDVDFDFQGGAEIRFGSTFGDFGSCGQGCGCCTHQPYAWEVVYWGIAPDDNTSVRTDIYGGMPRMYSMINYAGITYDRNGGTGPRPLTDYWGSPPPIDEPTPGDVEPVAYMTRTSYSIHNLELNFLRLPLCGGVGMCGLDCGGCGCDPCQDCFTPVCSVTGLCGFRYMRFDDDFLNAVQFASDATMPYDGFYAGDGTAEIFHEISVDNHLTGLQFGANVDYMITPCWSLFAYSNFGVFNNHMKHYQRVFARGGMPTDMYFTNGDGAVSVRSSKDDIAFLGELRLGAAYQVSCNCRLTAAWRAVAVSGAALSINQIHPFYNYESVACIDSQGSLILHGLQVGSEFKF